MRMTETGRDDLHAVKKSMSVRAIRPGAFSMGTCPASGIRISVVSGDLRGQPLRARSATWALWTPQRADEVEGVAAVDRLQHGLHHHPGNQVTHLERTSPLERCQDDDTQTAEVQHDRPHERSR